MKKLKTTSKARITQLKPYWEEAQKVQDRYWKEIAHLEDSLRERFGIEYELFHCDGSLAGIGDYSRTIALINAEKLESEKK